MPSDEPSSEEPSQPEKAPTQYTRAWDELKTRANTIGSIGSLFLFLAGAGAIGGYYYSQSKKTPAAAPKTNVQNLTQDEINKLSEVGANLGTAGQTLNIGANTLFRGKADVTGDLSIGGRLNANGPVTLSQLNITGNTAATGLNVGSNLIVGGTTTLQKSLTVDALTTINGGLSVSGTASVGTLNANAIAVRNISISGPLTIGHLTTQGPNPGIVAGTAVGGGGTVSISGNDTSGTVNFNIGNSPPALGGVLGTITFRASFGTTVHVLLSPLSGAAANTRAYVTRTSAGFTVRTDSTPAAGTLAYDYFVTQ